MALRDIARRRAVHEELRILEDLSDTQSLRRRIFLEVRVSNDTMQAIILVLQEVEVDITTRHERFLSVDEAIEDRAVFVITAGM